MLWQKCRQVHFFVFDPGGHEGHVGGSMAGAIKYKSGVDMATGASYPYKAADGTCKTEIVTS